MKKIAMRIVRVHMGTERGEPETVQVPETDDDPMVRRAAHEGASIILDCRAEDLHNLQKYEVEELGPGEWLVWVLPKWATEGIPFMVKRCDSDTEAPKSARP